MKTRPTGNHNLKFEYTKDLDGWIVRTWCDGRKRDLGRVTKAADGYEMTVKGVYAGWRQGRRDFAAEALAVKAGLLDGNYNAVDQNPPPDQVHESSDDPAVENHPQPYDR